MRGVILVGGEGNRLRPLTCGLPKPMVPIVNRPFLEHMIRYLARHGIDDIVLSLCYLPDRIQQHFGDGQSLGVSLRYVVEPEPLGTAGAIKFVESRLGLDDTTFIFNGDVFTDLDLTLMLAYHRSVGAKTTIALTPVEDPTAYGVVEQEPDGRVRRFIEKPSWDAVTTHNINAGTYIIEPDVLKYVPPNVHYMFENGLFPVLLQVGEPFHGFAAEAYWIDIGTPERYLAVHHDLLTGRCDVEIDGRHGGDGVWIGEGAMIEKTARATGPVVVGRGVVVGAHAHLIGPVVLGDDVVLDDGSTVENAVLWSGVRLGSGAAVRGSVIGSEALIEASSSVLGGSIVGDRVRLGASNKLDRGAKIWPDRDIPPHTISF